MRDTKHENTYNQITFIVHYCHLKILFALLLWIMKDRKRNDTCIYISPLLSSHLLLVCIHVAVWILKDITQNETIDVVQNCHFLVLFTCMCHGNDNTRKCVLLCHLFCLGFVTCWYNLHSCGYCRSPLLHKDSCLCNDMSIQEMDTNVFISLGRS